MRESIDAEIVEENQVVLSEIKYPVSRIDLDALKEEYKDIPNIDADADENIVGEQYQFVSRGHKAFVKARTSIEKTRKELKAPALEYGKKVDEIAKELQSTVNGIEEKLFIERKKVEDNEARKQREAEEAEEARIDKIKGLMLDVKNLPLQHFNSDSLALTSALESLQTITKEVYEELFDEAVENQNIVISLLQTARDNRLTVENAEKIQAEAKAKADAEEAEKQALRDAEQKKFYDERLEFLKQKEAFEAQQREAQEAREMLEAEQRAEELMKQQEEERKQREEMKAEMFDSSKSATLAVMKEFDNMNILLDSIIQNKIPNLKWEM